MKFLYSTLASLVLLDLCHALPQGSQGISPSVPVLKKRARDCGTWKMKCANAAGACNNACFHINCVIQGNNKFTYGTSPVDNRVHSGCTTTGDAFCKAPPFSQRTTDRIPDDVAAKPLDCDEFPMNAFKQEPFQNGDYRNSLRCIDRSENQSGGSQFRIFQKAQGDYAPGGKFEHDRTCGTDELGEDDTFSVEFIIDGEDGIPAEEQDKRVPYCKPNPNCANDGFQYHMTQLQTTDGGTGRLSNPYNYNTDNQYELDNARDVRLYRIKIHRIGQDQFTVDVLEVNGSDEVTKGSKTDAIPPGQWMVIEGALPHQNVNIKSNGAPGTVVEFSIGNKDGFNFNGGDFSWKSDEIGEAGAYCEVGDVNHVGNSEQYIKCDFPGMAEV